MFLKGKAKQKGDLNPVRLGRIRILRSSKVFPNPFSASTGLEEFFPFSGFLVIIKKIEVNYDPRPMFYSVSLCCQFVMGLESFY